MFDHFRRRNAGKDTEPPPPVDAAVPALPTYITTYASQALAHDGWEHATSYHYMVSAADQVRFVAVLPQHHLPNGEGLMYSRGYDESMWSLIDARPRVRKWGFLGFVLAAAKCAEVKIKADTDG